MSRPVVRLLIALKLSSLGRGHSGIRGEVMDALVTLFNADVLADHSRQRIGGRVGRFGAARAYVGRPARHRRSHRARRAHERCRRSEARGFGTALVASERRARAAQRHASLDGAGALQLVRDRRPLSHGARRGRALGRCGRGLRQALRRTHSRVARPSRPDRRGGCLSHAARRLRASISRTAIATRCRIRTACAASRK